MAVDSDLYARCAEVASKSDPYRLTQMAATDDFDAIDPFPDVHALFLHYNRLYFDESLGACSVEWSSSRMTL